MGGMAKKGVTTAMRNAVTLVKVAATNLPIAASPRATPRRSSTSTKALKPRFARRCLN